MRRILFVLIMPLHFILGLPYLGLILLIGHFNRKKRISMAYAYNRLTSWLLYKIAGAKFVIIGKENVPEDTNVLFVSNHRSMLDIPLVMLQFKKPLIFIGKDAIKHWPFVGWWLNAMDGLFLNRSNPKEGLKVILAVIERMKKGESCIIYPEGTRSKDEHIMPFKQGSLKLASKTGVPIVPMAVLGTDDVFENNTINLKAETVYLSIGKPIYLADLSQEEQSKSATYVQEIIEVLYLQLIQQREEDLARRSNHKIIT